MQDFQGKVAVVTGAGGKVGLALSRRFASEGMKVVMVDRDEADLAQAADGVRAQYRDAGGADVVTASADISKREGIQEVADRTLEAFGAVHVVCNNAGVNPQDISIWEAAESDWHWAMGVNLWQMVHSARVFVPIMLQQGGEGHIVNTASAAGLAGRAGMGSYAVSKAACVQFSEVLYQELRRIDSQIGVSVLCPGRIRGGGTKNKRPEEYVESEEQRQRDQELYAKALSQIEASGGAGYIPPDDVAGLVFDAIRDNRFYIFTHPDAIKQRVMQRAQAIADDQPPFMATSIF